MLIAGATLSRSGESSWKRAIVINVPPFLRFYFSFFFKLKFIEMRRDHACLGGCTKHRVTNSTTMILISVKPGGTFTFMGQSG